MELHDEIINSVSSGSVFNVDLKKKVLQLDKNNDKKKKYTIKRELGNQAHKVEIEDGVKKLFDWYQESLKD